MIGPAGHGNDEWREIRNVETPPDRRGSPFYMEAECACILANIGWQVIVERGNALGVPWNVHYENVNYAVPEVVTDQPMTYEYFKACVEFQEEWKRKHL